MPSMPPNQQRQNTEGKKKIIKQTDKLLCQNTHNTEIIIIQKQNSENITTQTT